jgi:hypothetical protein
VLRDCVQKINIPENLLTGEIHLLSLRSRSDKGLVLKRISELFKQGKVKEDCSGPKGFAEKISRLIFVLPNQKSSLEGDVLEEKECKIFLKAFG